MSALTKLNADVESARETLTSKHTAWLNKKSKFAAAKAVADEERYQRGLALSMGGPRRAPGTTPPPTAAEIAETAAGEACDTAERERNSAQAAFNNAEAQKLAYENRKLTRARDLQAMAIKEAERTGAPQEVIEPMRAQLRMMCPPDTAVRIHQRCPYSSLVRDTLDEQPHELHLDKPVNEL